MSESQVTGLQAHMVFAGVPEDIAAYFAEKIQQCMSEVREVETSLTPPKPYRGPPNIGARILADVLALRGYTRTQGGGWKAVAPNAAQAQTFDAYAVVNAREGFKTDDAMLATFGHTEYRFWATERLRKLGLVSQTGADAVRRWKPRKPTVDEVVAKAGALMSERLAKSFEHAQVHSFPNPTRK